MAAFNQMNSLMQDPYQGTSMQGFKPGPSFAHTSYTPNGVSTTSAVPGYPLGPRMDMGDFFSRLLRRPAMQQQPRGPMLGARGVLNNHKSVPQSVSRPSGTFHDDYDTGLFGTYLPAAGKVLPDAMGNIFMGYGRGGPAKTSITPAGQGGGLSMPGSTGGPSPGEAPGMDPAQMRALQLQQLLADSNARFPQKKKDDVPEGGEDEGEPTFGDVSGGSSSTGGGGA